jgi:hypothetical protein
LLLYLGLTSQACRFLVDARRSGLIELFLVTPLTVPQIVHGQFRALWRMFGVPLVLGLAVQFYGNFIAQQEQMKIMATATASVPAPPPPRTVRPGTNPTKQVTTTTPALATTSASTGGVTLASGGSTAPHPAVLLAIALVGTLTVLANLAALVWFGMWMGLNSKSGNAATLKTILFVQVIPWFVVSFASMILVPLVLMPNLMKGGTAPPANFMFWYPLMITGVTSGLALLKDGVFVMCSRRLLLSKFRERATQIGNPIRHNPPARIPLAGTAK